MATRAIHIAVTWQKARVISHTPSPSKVGMERSTSSTPHTDARSSTIQPSTKALSWEDRFVNSTGYDRALKKVRSLCLALPEAREIEAWGQPTFRAGKKMFAAFGDECGPLSLALKVSYERQDELLDDDRF